MLPCLLSGCHAICNDLLPPGPISLTPYLFRAILPSMILMPMRQTQSIQEGLPPGHNAMRPQLCLKVGGEVKPPWMEGRQGEGAREKAPRIGKSQQD